VHAVPGAQHAAASWQRLRPSDFWVEQFTEQVYDLMPGAFTARDVSAILTALARLQHRPSTAWLHSLMAEVLPHLHSLQPREAHNILAAHASLRLPVQPQLQEWLWQQGQQQLARWQPSELAMLLWALGRLQLAPPRPWLQQLLAVMAQQMHAFEPREVAAMVYGLCKLGPHQELVHQDGSMHSSYAAWLDALLRSTQRRLQEFRPWELSNLLWSLARLRVQLPADWLHAYLDVVGQQVDGFGSPAAAVQVLGALEELGLSPGRAWLQSFMAAVAPGLADAQYWELQKLLASLNSIDMVLGLQWTSRLHAGVQQEEVVQ
jgi:hypothetical protein